MAQRDIQTSSENVKLALQTNVQSDNPRNKKRHFGAKPLTTTPVQCESRSFIIILMSEINFGIIYRLLW